MDTSNSETPCSTALEGTVPVAPAPEHAPAIARECGATGEIEFLRDHIVVSFGDGPAEGPSVPDPHDPPPKKCIEAAAYCIAALRHSTSSAFEVQLKGTVRLLNATVTIREPALRKLPVLWNMFVVRLSNSAPQAHQQYFIGCTAHAYKTYGCLQLRFCADSSLIHCYQLHDSMVSLVP